MTLFEQFAPFGILMKAFKSDKYYFFKKSNNHKNDRLDVKTDKTRNCHFQMNHPFFSQEKQRFQRITEYAVSEEV